MSITSRNGGTAAAGTTSIAPAYPTNISAGQKLVLVVVNKYPTNGPTTPSGWTADTGYQASGGLGANAVDSGSMYCSVFTKVADGTETGTVTVTVTSGNSSYGRIFRFSGTAGTDAVAVSVAIVSAAQILGQTNWSVVTGNVDIKAGDMVVACSAINSDTYTFSAEAFSQSGTTFGTVNEFADSNTLQGDDCGMVVADCLVTAGSGTGPLTYSMTASGSSAVSPAGVTVILVMREVFAFHENATDSVERGAKSVSSVQLGGVLV